MKEILNLLAQATPEIPSITNVMPTSVDVTWGGINGSIEYTVTATSVNQTLVAQTSTGLITTLTISGLTPGQTYNVTVQATYSTGAGPSSVAVRQITGVYKLQQKSLGKYSTPCFHE